MRAKVAKKTGPSLAAAKHLRALFESHAVRQKAHDARLDLQKRIKDQNSPYSSAWTRTACGT